VSGGIRAAVLGIDGSAHARRATRFLARLRADARGRAIVVRVVEPLRLPSLPLLPGAARDQLAAELRRDEEATRARAQRTTDAAAALLREAGWNVEARVVSGVPLAALLAVVERERADLLVLGGRGTGGLGRLLLGSVAEGALRRSPVPVLIVK
jgi:nucleotide-binding universal stress UspA family protein